MTADSQNAGALPPLAAAAARGSLTGEQAFDAFVDFATAGGIELYPAQEEAILEIMGGASVILATPTGSGKSLVALAMHFKALSERRRSFYTAPIKALVSEKFFALCAVFGAANVGMMTGDAAINATAPIICCTAEVLSNMALRLGGRAGLDYVIMDEFHYYSDRDRGVAWQVPLLTLPDATFLLMSATLGDVTEIQNDLAERTRRPVRLVSSEQRPVPLDFSYKETFVHESVDDMLSRGRAPIYVVSFTQREATELAQDLTSTQIATRANKERIRAELAGFRFDSPFGGAMRRYITAGIGVHHAGLLPKYRLLVERLAQAGMLQVISGTDTLGVGINVPIRTVIFTKLCKFDGEKVALLSVRDFKQIAGRAGRKGFDDRGWVVCQAPEHVVENRRAEDKARANAKKIKVRKVQPPERGYVPWDAKIFERLIHGRPEPLKGRFRLDHGMLLNLLQRRDGQGYRHLVRLIDACHETPGGKKKLRRQARMLFVSLQAAGIVTVAPDEETGRARARVHLGLQSDFSLHHSLSLFLVESLERLEALKMEPKDYALAVLSLVEAIQENPLQILNAQTNRLKREAIAAMKASGMDYEERMQELEKISYPKPLADLLYDLFNAYADKHPWVGRENVYPKSIFREMFENYCSFAEYVRQYGLETIEGALLRYLSGCYKVLARTVPIAYLNDELVEGIGFFRAMLERVDSSLLREWEEMLAPAEEAPTEAPRPPTDITRDVRAFFARIRAEAHALVRALAVQDWEEAAACVYADPEDPWTPAQIEAQARRYYAEYDFLRADHVARLPEHTVIKAVAPRVWEVRQTLLDPADDGMWYIDGVVDLHASTPAEGPILRLRGIAS